MAILKDFPASKAISPSFQLSDKDLVSAAVPRIVEVAIKLKDLKAEEHFKHRGGQYLKLQDNEWGFPRSICYKSGDHTSAGEIYGYDKDAEVIWLKREYTWTNSNS